ncbi:hypothetical protein E9840_05950 [Tissierella creatinini]|nr:hypothetical protein E9840_05950 [Tissierella creatinini]TJX63554.1 hypothetical protein E8P77_15005 [Soehngenia saccharolytica]
MNKRISMIILALILLMGNISYAQDIKFTDIHKSAWYINTITYLVSRGGISGYPDGSFRPNNHITKAEFLKALISSLGYKDIKSTTGHWAKGYIEKAEDLNIIDEDWLKEIDKPISRYEMARIISNTLSFKQESIPTDLLKYKNAISDFDSIPSTLTGETNGKSLSESVLESYVKGIVTGYPNGTFQGIKPLTRAEASTVIVRVLDNKSRIIINPNEESTENEVLRLVNIERSKAGVQPLSLSKEVSEVALLKSKDMALFNYFDHTSPNYGSPFEMMKDMGISYRAAGENLAVGYDTPAAVVKGWMDSPGHRKNILNSQFNKMGIGIHRGDRTYWTQMFTN